MSVLQQDPLQAASMDDAALGFVVSIRHFLLAPVRCYCSR